MPFGDDGGLSFCRSSEGASCEVVVFSEGSGVCPGRYMEHLERFGLSFIKKRCLLIILGLAVFPFPAEDLIIKKPDVFSKRSVVPTISLSCPGSSDRFWLFESMAISIAFCHGLCSIDLGSDRPLSMRQCAFSGAAVFHLPLLWPSFCP